MTSLQCCHHCIGDAPHLALQRQGEALQATDVQHLGAGITSRLLRLSQQLLGIQRLACLQRRGGLACPCVCSSLPMLLLLAIQVVAAKATGDYNRGERAPMHWCARPLCTVPASSPDATRPAAKEVACLGARKSGCWHECCHIGLPLLLKSADGLRQYAGGGGVAHGGGGGGGSAPGGVAGLSFLSCSVWKKALKSPGDNTRGGDSAAQGGPHSQQAGRAPMAMAQS